jgi:hypothetical protein
MFSRHLIVRNARNVRDVRNARALSTSQALAKADRPKDAKGLNPKILDDKPPKEEELSEDAKKHNHEMSQRAEQAHEKLEQDTEPEKAPKGMFSGASNCIVLLPLPLPLANDRRIWRYC